MGWGGMLDVIDVRNLKLRNAAEMPHGKILPGNPNLP